MGWKECHVVNERLRLSPACSTARRCGRCVASWHARRRPATRCGTVSGLWAGGPHGPQPPANRDLAALVGEQKFREDLFYRLNVFPVTVPPLRDRREDIPMLVRHFAQQFARRMKKTIETIPTDTMEALTRYDWPGNIRELQNLIERAVILSSGQTLDVPVPALGTRQTPAATRQAGETLEEADRRHIIGALERSNWVLAGPNGAASRLGIKRSTLQFRMRKLGIVRPQQH